MHKITGHGHSAGLLEPEQASDVSRSHVSGPRMYAETPDIPDPVLDETDNIEADEPFLRARRRVPVRRRGGTTFLSRFGGNSRWVRIVAVLIAIAALGLLAGAFLEVKSLLLHDSHFRLASTRNIQVTGNRVVPGSQALAVFTADTGRSIYRVPLAIRQAELEQIRWVRRATVMRLWPNRLRVNIVERTPIAFARNGGTIRLVDQDGVLLDLPNAAAQHYSFPVLTGLSSGDPLSARSERIDLYRQFVQALDADGEHISVTLSEVDLSDPEDVRAIFSGNARQPLVHFGTSDFLPRYQAYRSHLAEWLQQYPQLRSVDMRYGRQVVLDTGTGGETPSAQPDTTTAETQPAIQSPEKNATPAHAAVASKTILAKSKSAKPHGRNSVAARHHATIHKAIHKHAPERGHPVRRPIMHIVSGA